MLRSLLPTLIACLGLHQSKDHTHRRPHFAMSPKRWFLLLIFYISYLMFGASIYYHIEHGLEKQQRKLQLQEQTEVNDYLMDLLADYNDTMQNDALNKLSDYCGKPVTAPTEEEFQIPYKWTFYHSFFFVFTVCSTVGYGNLSPSSPMGQMIMIVYSVIGIPVNGILYAGLGEYFGKMFVAIYRRYKKYKMVNNTRYVPLQLGLITTVIVALVPGITFFLLLPAWIFTYFEGWPFVTSLYYAYVTTTTIGFGDYVATFEPSGPSKFGGWFVVYEIYVIVWMIISLGYLVMIMTFLTRGLQSKRLTRLEQQLSTNIKATQSRIWSGVTKDVGNLRRLLNEMYIMKFKPVYTEPDVALLQGRSLSCPDLTIYRDDDAWPSTVCGRKRAYSECYGLAIQAARGQAEGTPSLLQAISDTALDKLDKQRTFETAETLRSTTELLAKVVNALAAVKVPPMDDEAAAYGVGSADMYGGYHGFSDSQILASEWSFTSNVPPPKPRGRARSDFNIVRHSLTRSNDWTWSGDNNQIQAAINKRSKHISSDDLYRSVLENAQQQPPHDYVVQMEDDDLYKRPPAKKFSIPDGLRKLFKRQSSQDTMSAVAVKAPSNRKISIMSVPETQQHQTPPLDYYSTVTANASPTFFQQQQKQLQQHQQQQTGNPALLNSADLLQALENAKSKTANAASTSNALPPPPTYQRNAAAANKKRRESVFAQNPALSARRGSAVTFSQQQQQQQQQRRGSGVSGTMQLPPVMQRRGSMFPTTSARRPSIFSVTSEEDMEVLENTTVADLIRALELVHTQSVMEEAAAVAAPPKAHVGFVDCFSSNRQKRRDTNAGLNPPDLPPIVSLFGGNSDEALTAIAANRLYARRATVVGNSLFTAPLVPSAPAPASSSNATANVLTRRRKSAVQIVDPPPSYTEHAMSSSSAAAAAAAAAAQSSAPVSVISKFKRRFSIRPTALSIPPGKAPPAATTPSAQQATSGAAIAAAASSTTPAGVAGLSQTALQRRLSLRPSPLARELNIQTNTAALERGSSGGSSGGGGNVSDTSGPSSPTTPLVAPSLSRPPPTSSTHSPLSRIVQISQAQRKSSMPDVNPKKPDANK